MSLFIVNTFTAHKKNKTGQNIFRRGHKRIRRIKEQCGPFLAEV
jgi:hypothetical protein